MSLDAEEYRLDKGLEYAEREDEIVGRDLDGNAEVIDDALCLIVFCWLL